MIWLLLAAGGAAGAIARWALAGAISARVGAAFPWGTLVVNVLGSFLLGVVLTGLADRPYELQLGALLAVGFLGDFTTFSTFAYEAVTLARGGHRRQGLVYVAASMTLALLAVAAGMACGLLLQILPPP